MPDAPERPAPGPETVPARLAELAELLGGESPRSRRFLGGLVIGALAGAAAVGLAALARRADDRPDAPEPPDR
jgi:hypothetical protein